VFTNGAASPDIFDLIEDALRTNENVLVAILTMNATR